jgi:hypothetical protein
LFGANFRGASNTVLRDSLFDRAIFGSTFYLDATTVFTII